MYVEDLDLRPDDEHARVHGKGGTVRTVLLDDRGYLALLRLYLARSGYTSGPQWPAGRSPFAGIARIRSLGVAVQPLSCPRPLSLSSRLRVSPALRSVQLPRSPRRRYSRCMASMRGA